MRKVLSNGTLSIDERTDKFFCLFCGIKARPLIKRMGQGCVESENFALNSYFLRSLLSGDFLCVTQKTK